MAGSRQQAALCVESLPAAHSACSRLIRNISKIQSQLKNDTSMDEPTEPTEPLERPRRRARARLFVLLEGGVQPDDAKVFDRGKRHTHT